MNLDEVAAAAAQDLATKDGAEGFARAAMNIAREFYNENAWHPWIAYVLATRAVSPEQPIPPGEIGIITMIAEKIAGEADKAMFERTTRTVVEQARAIGVVMITEAFYVKTTSLVEMADVLEKGTTADHPGRCEGIVARLEHIRAAGCWIGEIRNGRVDAFERLPEDMVGVGRFTDLLRKERFA